MEVFNEEVKATSVDGKEKFVEPSYEFVEFSFKDEILTESSNLIEDDYFI